MMMTGLIGPDLQREDCWSGSSHDDWHKTCLVKDCRKTWHIPTDGRVRTVLHLSRAAHNSVPHTLDAEPANRRLDGDRGGRGDRRRGRRALSQGRSNARATRGEVCRDAGKTVCIRIAPPSTAGFEASIASCPRRSEFVPSWVKGDLRPKFAGLWRMSVGVHLH